MSLAAPLLALILVVSVIWYLGGGQFGRSQTQRWINRAGRWPRLHRFLDRHHGKFRAAAHYFEFGGLFLVLYWLWDVLFRDGRYVFEMIPALIIAMISVFAAYLDEMHQLKSGTRQFRREDFLHSCCGVAIAMAIVLHATLLRGL